MHAGGLCPGSRELQPYRVRWTSPRQPRRHRAPQYSFIRCSFVDRRAPASAPLSPIGYRLSPIGYASPAATARHSIRLFVYSLTDRRPPRPRYRLSAIGYRLCTPAGFALVAEGFSPTASGGFICVQICPPPACVLYYRTARCGALHYTHRSIAASPAEVCRLRGASGAMEAFVGQASACQSEG